MSDDLLSRPGLIVADISSGAELIDGLDFVPSRAEENAALRFFYAHVDRENALWFWRASPYYRYGMRIPGLGARARRVFLNGRGTKQVLRQRRLRTR